MTTTDIEIRRDSAALAIQPGQEFWDDRQRAALVALGIKDATNADLAVFMHYCQKTALDPFSKQIYLLARRTKENDEWVTKQTIQVGIGGFQVIRDRVAQRLGVSVEYEDTVWYDADGGEHLVWLADGQPAACRVVVLKDGKRFPAVVRFSAYVQTNRRGEPNSMWTRMGAEQLEKCAEAKALRKAFPNDLSGVYIPEEMHDDDHPAKAEVAASSSVTVAEVLGTSDAPTEPDVDRATDTQRTRVAELFGTLATELPEPRDKAAFVSEVIGREVASFGELTAAETDAVIGRLESWVAQDQPPADVPLIADLADEPPADAS